MTPLPELFAEYVFAERAGQGDPRPFLERAEPADRDALAEMIDAYLAHAPGKGWDPEAFRDSAARAMIEPLTRSLDGVSGTWPVLLPSLRERARIKRADLVERLSAKLGFPGQREVVGEYYHGMEYGTVEADGVSGRVLDALGEILGAPASALRRAGELAARGESGRDEVVFARQARVESIELADADADMLVTDAPADADRIPDPERDAVVELFTGGL